MQWRYPHSLLHCTHMIIAHIFALLCFATVDSPLKLGHYCWPGWPGDPNSRPGLKSVALPKLVDSNSRGLMHACVQASKWVWLNVSQHFFGAGGSFYKLCMHYFYRGWKLQLSTLPAIQNSSHRSLRSYVRRIVRCVDTAYIVWAIV